MKIHVDRRRWNLAIVNLVLVILVLICLGIFAAVAGTLDSHSRGPDRFRGESDMRFAQIACFLPEGHRKDRGGYPDVPRNADAEKNSWTPPSKRLRAASST